MTDKQTGWLILLGTGCRIGECLGLRWEDLDYENKVIQSVMGHRNIETTMDIYAEAKTR